MERPETEHYELVARETVAMASERAGHARAKFRIARQLSEAVEAARLPCTVFPDGMAVLVDTDTVYEPDAFVRCDEDIPPDAGKVTDPLIAVEVLSPSSRPVDTGLRFTDYFRIPSIRHALVVRAETRAVVHHARAEDGSIATRIVEGRRLRLDLPGVELALFG